MTAGQVDFFIAGVQKGGTTALDQRLRGHPQIRMARRKEVHHFDDETVDWTAPDHGRLAEQYDWSLPGVIRGEATPIYIYWPQALHRLRDYAPAAKIILCLRHPTFRAFSQWRMETRRGWESLSFEQAIAPEGRRRVAQAPGGVHRVHSYVERGLYAGQVRTLLSLFPRRQVLFLRMEDLWAEPSACLASVERFLGVGPAVSLDPGRDYVEAVPGAAAPQPPLSERTRAMLDDLYRDDIRETAALTGLDLSDWTLPGYAEPVERRG